jgi:hypothetical protein
MNALVKRALVLTASLLGLWGCGIKGAPRPPLSSAPTPPPTTESPAGDASAAGGQRGPLPSSLPPPDSGTP